MKKINIVVMGAPNSGKGTLCERLLKDFNFYHLSTGQILRDNIEQNTPLGKLAKPHMLGIVPNEIVTDMVLEKIKTTEGFDGIIFDGYPRTVSQALALDNNVKIDLIILLDCKPEDEEKLISRALNRVVCENCKATLSVSMLKSGACPNCGGMVKTRDDATVENAKKRLEVYRSETLPILDYYKNRVVRIDAFAGKEEIAESAEKLIKSVLVKK